MTAPDRSFWSTQPRSRVSIPSQSMRLMQCGAQSFELTLGPVRIDLSAADVFKLRTLLERGASLATDQLTGDDDEEKHTSGESDGI